jgi:ubiquitin-large subunit ribosomal protein L40e
MDTVIIRQVNQKDFSMNISGLKTINDLKGKMKEDLNLKSSNQRLIYAGKELMNDKNISDYNLNKDSVIMRHCKNGGG